MKKLFALILALLMFCSCGVQQEPVEEPKKEEVSEDSEVEHEEQQEPEELFDPETEKIFEILWNSEKPSEEVSKGGHAFYGAEKCYGYENLLAFAEKYPENKNENFYVATYSTTWKLYEILYSEADESWVFAEYWTDVYNNNKRHERITNISEIKIYDNRVSIYLETGGKTVVYEKGNELGLPINNCSHPWHAHYIEIQIINYINSEEFRTKYEQTHDEQYLSFDEFTDTLYGEEEECVMNIYHYIEYYGLTYDDFISAYGSEEEITEFWGETDIKGYFEK